MTCPNCGAATYEDHRGAWHCTQGCGWGTNYTTKGTDHGMSTMRGGYHADANRRLVLRELRVAVRSPRPDHGRSCRTAGRVLAP